VVQCNAEVEPRLAVGRIPVVACRGLSPPSGMCACLCSRCCNGRIVSVLEGGYRIQGGIVSAFARSVAAHVRALMDPHRQKWSGEDARVSAAALCMPACRAKLKAVDCAAVISMC
jgi:hypothetical protein